MTEKCTSVDSNDISFQLAASGAFKSVPQCASQLLEPMYHVEILAPDECTGDVMEIYKRRAMISGMDSEVIIKKIMAEVPLAEMNDYSSTLRSLTGGRAKISMKFEVTHNWFLPMYNKTS